MSNLIAFGNVFFSYLLLAGITAGLAAAAVFLGIYLRRRKDAKDAKEPQAEEG